MNTIRQDIENIFNGITPIKRQCLKPGKSQYYCINPNQNVSSFSDLQITDISDKQALFDTGQRFKQNGQANNQNCYMTFDGKNLNLYNNSGLVNSLDAQSGHDDFQNGQYQNVANKGPIPEGTYYANQDQRLSLTLKDVALKLGEKLGINTNQKSNWSGYPTAWGTHRVWLQPDANTNTYGRSGFTIHGGLVKGSRGCIDIPWQTDRLNNYLDDCQDSVPVYVKYPNRW